MDVIDVAQQRQMEEIEHALASRRTLPLGLTHCERFDCREPIITARQLMGARLCIDCATAHELEARRTAVAVAAMTVTKLPSPASFRGRASIYAAATDMQQLATTIVERAWRCRGVRVYRWPCGTLLLAPVGGTVDQKLLSIASTLLLGTWCHAATKAQVLDTLRWAVLQ